MSERPPAVENRRYDETASVRKKNQRKSAQSASSAFYSYSRSSIGILTP